MREMKRTFGKSALVALVLWFALAAGSVWATAQETHGTGAEGNVTTEGHAVSAAGHDTEAATAHGEATGAHEESDSLAPAKVKDFGFRVMNFAVLMIILVKFGAKPIANGLGARRKQVRDELEGLESKKRDAEKTYKEFSVKLAEVEKNAEGIVGKAQEQAEIEKVRIIEAAERSADDVKRAAEMAIANEVTAAKRLLKVQVTEQAAGMAEELIVKNLTAADQVKIIEDYLDKVGAVQ